MEIAAIIAVTVLLFVLGVFGIIASQPKDNPPRPDPEQDYMNRHW